MPGSPIYYKYYNGGYAVAIVNERYEFQYFDEYAMKFLADMVNQGKLLRNKKHKDIDEDSIEKLELSTNNFGPLDIEYLMKFDLKNLKILNLSCNPLKAKGAFYLSQGKLSCLEVLALNACEIGDEGLNYIAIGSFFKLRDLHLFHNYISYEGIKYLVKADFVGNLVFLSLSENPGIGNLGIQLITECKKWSKLNTLKLNETGLTNEALKYFSAISMLELRNLFILENEFEFNEDAKTIINGLRMNHIAVVVKLRKKKNREKK